MKIHTCCICIILPHFAKSTTVHQYLSAQYRSTYLNIFVQLDLSVSLSHLPCHPEEVSKLAVGFKLQNLVSLYT